MINLKFFSIYTFFFLMLTLFLFPQRMLFPAIDLEESIPDFILETKQIKIPDYPDAFNPSIIRWGESLLMTFRTRDPLTQSTDAIGLTWLTDNFNPVGKPYFVDRLDHQADSPSFLQDSRLVGIGNKVYIVYNNMTPVSDGKNRRMFILELHFDGVRFFIDEGECLLKFEGENSKKQEKNWAPFFYKGDLLLAYSLQPHTIFKPIIGKKKCETLASTKGLIEWNWGELRGGTPALLDGSRYLAFFHSSKNMATAHSSGKNITHYFMGAYTFSAKPPFEMTAISPKPIVGKNFYWGPDYKTWKPLRVVFPGGFVQDDQFIWLVYGRQDFETWVVKFDKQKLYQSLIPVETVVE